MGIWEIEMGIPQTHFELDDGAVMSVSILRIANQPMFKYLDVKEAESSLLPPRLCVQGVDVSIEAGKSKIPCGIDTF